MSKPQELAQHCPQFSSPKAPAGKTQEKLHRLGAPVALCILGAQVGRRHTGQKQGAVSLVKTHLVIIRVCHIQHIPLLVPRHPKWMLKLRIDAYSINITKSK